MKIDQMVYPEIDSPPKALHTLLDRADYVHRICANWDYGILPESDTIAQFAEWREVFDRFPLGHSAAYHAFRFLYHWEPIQGRSLRAAYEIDDLREGRADPCANWV